jgi:hypothetical protein
MFSVNMSEWMFQTAMLQGAFWLRRPDRHWCIIVECFSVDVTNHPGGWVTCQFHMKIDDQWARLVYWRLLHGAATDGTARRHRVVSLGTIQGEW